MHDIALLSLTFTFLSLLFSPLLFLSDFFYSLLLPFSSSLLLLSLLFLSFFLSLSHLIFFSPQAVSSFYTKYVEQGAPDSWPVKLWATLSQNSILKEKLIDFFDSQTDFSKRLTSWKANSKVRRDFIMHCLITSLISTLITILQYREII